MRALRLVEHGRIAVVEPLDDGDPVTAGPLADAGLTTYLAIDGAVTAAVTARPCSRRIGACGFPAAG